MMRENKVYIVAEMSANHGGKLENAIAIIKEAKRCGADAIKLQTYTADTLTLDCDNDYFKIKGGLWDGQSLYKLYESAYTPWEWHETLFEIARSEGIDIFSSPFDSSAIDLLESLDCPIYKIASFENGDFPLLAKIARTGKPIIMSTGMIDKETIDNSLQWLKKHGATDIALLKCTSSYPATLDQSAVSIIPQMIKDFNCRVGLSDHTPGWLLPVVATSLGATVIEKHFCLSREIKTPDSSFSMTPDEFRTMAESVRQAESALTIKEYGLVNSEKQNLVFRRSVFAVRDIEPGERFTKDNIRVIRPGYGIQPMHYEELVNNRVAATKIEKGHPIEWHTIKPQ